MWTLYNNSGSKTDNLFLGGSLISGAQAPTSTGSGLTGAIFTQYPSQANNNMAIYFASGTSALIKTNRPY